MEPRPLGRTGLEVTPIGFGAFKIGRNQAIKYPRGYELPDDGEATRLIHGVLDLGINFIDTAPAYGLSEERVGAALDGLRAGGRPVVSTKVGETFEAGVSRYDYSASAVRASVERSLARLRTDRLDIVLIHSDGGEVEAVERSDAVEALLALRAEGLVRCVGLSGKTVAGAEAALKWADVVMVPYHLDDRSHAAVIERAAERGVGVVVKKGLASGRLDPAAAIRFVLGTPGVASLVIGGLNLEHLRANVRQAERCLAGGAAAGMGRRPDV